MRRPRKKVWPSGNQLRHLAWLLAAGPAVGSLFLLQHPLGLFLQILAAALFAVGTVWPRLFRGLFLKLVNPPAPRGPLRPRRSNRSSTAA